MHKLLLLLGFLHVHFPAVFFVSVNKVIPGETPLDVKLHVSETQRMTTKEIAIENQDFHNKELHSFCYSVISFTEG